MGKPSKRSFANRLRDILTELDRLLNPPRLEPARVPARRGPRR